MNPVVLSGELSGELSAVLTEVISRVEARVRFIVSSLGNGTSKNALRQEAWLQIDCPWKLCPGISVPDRSINLF